MELQQALIMFATYSSVFAGNVNEMEVLSPSYYKNPGQLGGSFSYTNCNTTAVPVYVKAMTVKPDILELGHMVTVSGVVQLLEDIGTVANSDEVDLSVKMKIGGKYKEMCDLLGKKACHIKDLCQKLPKYAALCPADIKKQGSNCLCPFKKNTYTLKETTVKLPDSPFEVAGSFEVTIRLVEKGKQIMCLDLKFCLEYC